MDAHKNIDWDFCLWRVFDYLPVLCFGLLRLACGLDVDESCLKSFLERWLGSFIVMALSVSLARMSGDCPPYG